MSTYIVNKDSIHIEDSYKIKKEIEMVKILIDIKNKCTSSEYFFNTVKMNTMTDEWKTNNLFYNLHILRSHTKNVDLNRHCKVIRICYWLFAGIYDMLSCWNW